MKSHPWLRTKADQAIKKQQQSKKRDQNQTHWTYTAQRIMALWDGRDSLIIHVSKKKMGKNRRKKIKIFPKCTIGISGIIIIVRQWINNFLAVPSLVSVHRSEKGPSPETESCFFGHRGSLRNRGGGGQWRGGRGGCRGCSGHRCSDAGPLQGRLARQELLEHRVHLTVDHLLREREEEEEEEGRWTSKFFCYILHYSTAASWHC